MIDIPYKIRKHLRKKTRRRAGSAKDSLRRISGLAGFKKLQYLVNALNYSGRIFADNVLEIALRYLTIGQKHTIIRETLSRAKKLKIETDRFATAFRNGSDSLDEVIQDLHRNDFLKRGIYFFTADCLAALFAKKIKILKPCTLSMRLDQISELFSLSAAEREILLLLYLQSTATVVDRLFDEVCSLTDLKNDYSNMTKCRKPFHIMSGMPKREIDGALSEKSQLIRAGLVDNSMDIAPEVAGFLEGTSSKPVSRKYFSQYEGSAVPIECHTIEKQHIEMVKTLRQHKPSGQGVNLLLYGRPGTGKTEFARSLGKSLGLDIYEIHNLDDEDDKGKRDLNMFRYRALAACQKMVDVEKSVIIVDEADSMLNAVPRFFSFSPIAEKGQINRQLDELNAFVVWITNRYDGIDESTKRRFDYSIGFEKLTFEQRKTIC
jgi:DNA polymerase III delta prime subunit